MAEVDLTIAGRTYRIACRAGEEENLRRAAAMVDTKSREALAGLGTLSEARQLLFASLLLADQILENDRGGTLHREQLAPSEPDPAILSRVIRLADQLEALADRLDS